MTKTSIHTAELGRLYEEQGYYEKAGEHFGAVLANDPDNPLLREAVERVSARTNGADGMAGLTGLVERWVSLLFLKRRAALLRHGKRSDG
ncbi:MAG: tetratricopeptide repeat protein [Desulfobacteraceae bacterium]|nr:tetratricopeptide repeat protein [Desulfobacteraceae bacterium]